jgi:hypothetical membrane protein
MGRATAISVVAILQFALSVTLSVQCYPGKFEFTRQYLSELGCCTPLLGREFFPQAWIFNLSLMLLGAGLAYFFVTMTFVTKDGKTELPVCGACGTCASISLFLVGVIPMDLSESLHVMAMCSWLFFMLPMSIGWMAWVREWYATVVAWRLINRCLVVAILAYAPVAMFGHATMWQKVVVLVAFAWLLLVCGQIIFVFRTGRVFEFQMYRFHKLHQELAARDRNRNR